MRVIPLRVPKSAFDREDRYITAMARNLSAREQEAFGLLVKVMDQGFSNMRPLLPEDLPRFSWLRERAFMLYAILVCIFCHGLDFLSSLKLPPGFIEGNPFVRSTSYQILFWHNLAYNGIWLLFILATAAVLYGIVRRFNELVAQVMFALIFLQDAGSAFAATVHNLWLHLGWFVA